jgi:hypothetical protein
VRAWQATLASITWLIDASDYFARHVRHRLCGSLGWKLFTCQRRGAALSDRPGHDDSSEGRALPSPDGISVSPVSSACRCNLPVKDDISWEPESGARTDSRRRRTWTQALGLISIARRDCVEEKSSFRLCLAVGDLVSRSIAIDGNASIGLNLYRASLLLPPPPRRGRQRSDGAIGERRRILGKNTRCTLLRARLFAKVSKSREKWRNDRLVTRGRIRCGAARAARAARAADRARRERKGEHRSYAPSKRTPCAAAALKGRADEPHDVRATLTRVLVDQLVLYRVS